VRDGESESYLLDGSCARSRRISPHLERELNLRCHSRGYDLGLRVLSYVADYGCQLTGAGGDRVDAGCLDPALDLAPVEVRDQAAGGAEEGRLAAGGAAGEEGELAGGQVERDVA
jgi:hypothetical protein